MVVQRGIPVWIRHVLVPTINDNDGALKKLATFIRTLSNVDKVDVLPYHKLGIYKWKELGLDYPFEGIEPPTQKQIANAEGILRTAIMKEKAHHFH